MNEHCFDSLRKYIMTALKDEFHLPVYGEQVEQKTNKPCFTVELLQTARQRMLGNRWEEKASFGVNFYPKDLKTAMAQCIDAADRLYEILSVVGSTDDCFAASSMQHLINKNCLHFTMDYVFHILYTDKDDMMERLKHNGKRVIGY